MLSDMVTWEGVVRTDDDNDDDDVDEEEDVVCADAKKPRALDAFSDWLCFVRDCVDVDLVDEAEEDTAAAVDDTYALDDVDVEALSGGRRPSKTTGCEGCAVFG